MATLYASTSIQCLMLPVFRNVMTFLLINIYLPTDKAEHSTHVESSANPQLQPQISHIQSLSVGGSK